MFLHGNSRFVGSLEKKILSKNVYNKYFIRHSFVNKHILESSVTVIDDNSSLGAVNLNLNFFKKNYFKKLVFERGHSVSLDNFLYTKKQIEFNYFTLNSQRSFLNYIPLFFRKLRALRSSKKVLILVNAKRGGFRCFFNGTCGFFPFKHFFHLVKLNEKYEFEWFFNQIQNKDIQAARFRQFLHMFVRNDILFHKFHVNLKKDSSVFKLSIFKFLDLVSSLGNFSRFFSLFKKEAFLALKEKYFFNNFFNLKNLALKKGRVLPRNAFAFVFYKLKFKIKNNYYNFFMRNNARLKTRKKLFFKSRVKLVFLSFIKSKTKKEALPVC